VGYNTDTSGLKDGACASCGHKIPGVWTQEQALAFKPKEKPAGAPPAKAGPQASP
jgi:hypothetical protein